MIYAYVRVSSNVQTVESQKIGIESYCQQNNLKIDKYITDDGVSGTVKASKRRLGYLLRIMRAGDTIIVSELSRLGRSTADVIKTCKTMADKGVNCHLVKQGMNLDQSPMGKLFISILSAMAEMERDLISQRTREGLARVKASGRKLGKPFGSKNRHHILDGKENLIARLWNAGKSKMAIARACRCSPRSLFRYYKTPLAWGRINTM